MKKILVIEDERHIRLLISKLLDFEGYQVVLAENGLEGVELAQQHLPDLIICDVNMPELNGYETLERIRNNNQTALTPFIFLTARESKDDVRRGMNIGADDYLTKPFDTEDLILAVKSRLFRAEKLAELTKSQGGAQVDILTGLPDRAELEIKLNEAFQQCNSDHSVGLLILGLDRFKHVNHALGRNKGDALLKIMATRLSELIKTPNQVFRLAGDEFVILLPNLSHVEDGKNMAFLVLQRIKEMISLDGHELRMTASVGSAFYPFDSIDSQTLLSQASTAMSTIKTEGGSQYLAYQPTMNIASFDELNLESHLYKALEQEQFELYYQPQVSLETGHLTGMEALIRWKHPRFGMVSPGQFMPIAEQSGLIVDIGEWVLRTACKQNKDWIDKGFPPLRISVNISTRQLQVQAFEDIVFKVLLETGLDAQYLELELTESILIKNVEDTIALLSKLKAMGVSISVDDFGTGYSSLAYLKKFPLDVLKIDQVFVRGLTQDADDEGIAKAIIQMGQTLGLKVIAEGVETPEQLEFLRFHKCDEIQGYYFSKPVPVPDFEQMLIDKKSLDI